MTDREPDCPVFSPSPPHLSSLFSSAASGVLLLPVSEAEADSPQLTSLSLL